MKCELCDQKATVFYSQLVDGQMKKVCLCDSCASEKGLTDPDAFSMVDMIMENEVQQADSKVVPSYDLSSCEHCGFTLADFKKVGRLGCSHCYDVFRGEVTGMLENMHRGTKHVGKIPVGLVDEMEKKKILEVLQSDLNSAVKAENYEEAAGLRDQIREVEDSISSVSQD